MSDDYVKCSNCGSAGIHIELYLPKEFDAQIRCKSCGKIYERYQIWGQPHYADVHTPYKPDKEVDE